MKLTACLLLAALLLTAIAHQRPPEYDEAYSIFLTAGDARPAWPSGVFTAGAAGTFFTGHASFAQISHDLKTGDVHPPLYFWCLEIWRHLLGPSWLIARLLSVIFSLSSLAVIAWLAEATEIPVLPALSLTLLSYGFAYTGIVARGFALAQFLNLLGFWFIFQTTHSHRRRLAFAGGLALGAASFTNYLAIFIALAALIWLCLAKPHRRFFLPTAIGLLPFILLDATYFLAQRHSRATQFAPFAPIHALTLLAKDFGACLFGGLPFAPATMQPQALAARQIARLAPPGTLVLLPYGNDGVGTPGPFIAAAPASMQILLLPPGNIPSLMREKSLALATLNADSSSRATTAQALASFRRKNVLRKIRRQS